MYNILATNLLKTLDIYMRACYNIITGGKRKTS
nr:MAG TPA: hypothetical protein [Caudoviricetes sp.]